MPPIGYLHDSAKCLQQSNVGRPPSPARKPCVRVRQRDGGVPRGPGGPPHQTGADAKGLSERDTQLPPIPDQVVTTDGAVIISSGDIGPAPPTASAGRPARLRGPGHGGDPRSEE